MNKYLLSIVLLMITASLFAQEQVSVSQIANTEKIFALSFSETKRDSMVSNLSDKVKTYNYIHSVNIDFSVPFPLWFNPVLPEMNIPKKVLKSILKESLSNVIIFSKKNHLMSG